MDETARFDSSQVADIHLRILTLLVDSLPDLQRVKWVLDRPHPTLVPDFRLTVDVIEFSSTLSIQKLFISAIFEISLESIEDNGKSKSDRLAVVFDTSTMSDMDSRSGPFLEMFFTKAASEVQNVVKEFLSD